MTHNSIAAIERIHFSDKNFAMYSSSALEDYLLRNKQKGSNTSWILAMCSIALKNRGEMKKFGFSP